jgi:golgi phosphoprotein 3
MLTMLEEVVLLAVDELTGRVQTSQGYGTGYALAGAVFFDLALAKKIDTDTDNVVVLDSTPTGIAILDETLARMLKQPAKKTVRSWIEDLKNLDQHLEDAALQLLVDRGVLKHELTKRLWIIDVERFPVVDDKPQRHVKLRLAQAILDDAIPDTRDIMLVSIAEACGLLGLVLQPHELQSRQQRIELLCGLETISRTVKAAIDDLYQHIRAASIQPM